METVKINSKLVKSKFTIIIPYRNDKLNERKFQLEKFIEFAKKTFDSNVKILIIEQYNYDKKFNRGKLLNIGVKLSKNIEYCIFHDIDLIPDNKLLEYYFTYPEKPIHIARVWKDKYSHYTFLGGIVSVSKQMLLDSNGFPNNFWGWGGEDDAFYNRLSNLSKLLYTPIDGTITELKHTQAEISKKDNLTKKKLILEDLKNWKENGLKNLKFKILEQHNYTDNIIKTTVII